ncbi:hypothetical protein CPAR01_09100 [Colletotrichum paranaense]|uniref:Uncharacterized protein n=1 Tax=Colletotrichum paranaense TaxID=1914294 RepID=A0ABQ9SH48_9PEZI|nr:uncharacterized protein CPAR01_09100 [Colletotrichum paranaense]KAK1535558.1 hypothetical protein CPAR01_09100 [Colletotrichum paranaense]
MKHTTTTNTNTNTTITAATGNLRFRTKERDRAHLPVETQGDATTLPPYDPRYRPDGLWKPWTEADTLLADL